MRKKIIFVFLLIFIIINIYNYCFATIDFTYDNNNYIMPDFPSTPEGLNDKDFFIYRANTKYQLLVKYFDTANIVYLPNDSLCSITDLTQFEINNNGFDNSSQSWNFSSWRSTGYRSIGSTNYIVYSTFDILDSDGNIYFESSIKPVIPEKVYNFDTLYIGDIPNDYFYADFNNSYIDLYNVSSATNETLNGYRIYFYDNTFMYKEISNTFTDTVNFSKINVSDKVYYRRDFPYICLTTFIIIIFFLWITNLFTTIIYKGGILRGLF